MNSKHHLWTELLYVIECLSYLFLKMSNQNFGCEVYSWLGWQWDVAHSLRLAIVHGLFTMKSTLFIRFLDLLVLFYHASAYLLLLLFCICINYILCSAKRSCISRENLLKFRCWIRMGSYSYISDKKNVFKWNLRQSHYWRIIK